MYVLPRLSSYGGPDVILLPLSHDRRVRDMQKQEIGELERAASLRLARVRLASPLVQAPSRARSLPLS